MNILIIITPFLPAQTPNTLRWVPIIDFFKSKGLSPIVLTTKRNSYADEEINAEGVKIYRAGHNTLLDFMSNVYNPNQRRNEISESNDSKAPGRFRKTLEKIVDTTWRKNYWPDGSQLFLKPGIKLGLEVVKKENITHVISVGLPFTSHLIAKHLKEQNPTLFWLQDIQDPFSYSDAFWVNNFSKYKSKNISEEKEAFRLSDSISTTNHVAKKKYEELFTSFSDKIKVISPLFSKPKTISHPVTPLDKRKINIGFFGSFYEGVRSPELFLLFLEFIHANEKKFLEGIQFHLFGQQSRFSLSILDQFKSLKEFLKIHGLQSRNQSISSMQEMDILLNFGNTTDYHLPSKVVDFLYINKPLINIISIENDSSKLFLSEYEDILNLMLKPSSFETQKDAFLNFIRKERKTRFVNLDSVSEYLPETIGQLYLDELSSSEHS